MLPPSVTIKRGGRRRGCAGELRGRRATERAVNAVGVVIILVFVQLSRQVRGIPEEYAVKILTPDPRVPIAHHLKIVPQRYAFRPSFDTWFA
jgi:hypothetical protein